MRKLVCKKCGKVWYTASTNNDENNMKCDDCGGKLEEVKRKTNN